MGQADSPRILLVEDEGIVLLELEMTVADLGYEIAGTACDFDSALRLARTLPFDVAVLDLNLAGRSSDPIADVLASRDIPFVFASGYTRTALPPRHADRPLLSKPFSGAALKRELVRLRGTGAHDAA